MTDLILWRHGQTDYNLQGRIQGRVDIPLNDTGREQARRAADCIAALGPTRIVSSPLLRARATAEVLASLTGLSVEIAPPILRSSGPTTTPPGALVATSLSSGSRGAVRPRSEWGRRSGTLPPTQGRTMSS